MLQVSKIYNSANIAKRNATVATIIQQSDEVSYVTIFSVLGGLLAFLVIAYVLVSRFKLDQ